MHVHYGYTHGKELRGKQVSRLNTTTPFEGGCCVLGHFGSKQASPARIGVTSPAGQELGVHPNSLFAYPTTPDRRSPQCLPPYDETDPRNCRGALAGYPALPHDADAR